MKEVETRKQDLMEDFGSLEPMVVGLLAQRSRAGAQKACEEVG